ncbi:MAG: LysM peptidoglycan-binding domain-containing protein [Planctomycetota bacterium]
MTKQARIGLLVGLAFIIMFGLVLTELVGPTAAPPPPQSSQAEPQDDGSVRAVLETGAIGPARDDGDDADEADGRGVRRREPVELSARGGETQRRTARRPSHTDEPARQRPERRPAGGDSGRRSAPRTYRVQPGDSLRSIARDVYGAEHEDQYRRIYEANRALLPDEDTLRIGQALVIPPLEGAAGRTRQRVAEGGGVEMDLTDTPGEPRSPLQRVVQRTRTYKVRSGDTLTNIARRLLGSGGRSAVDRLFDANRDRLTSRDVLPAGLTLRIPQ